MLVLKLIGSIALIIIGLLIVFYSIKISLKETKDEPIWAKILAIISQFFPDGFEFGFFGWFGLIIFAAGSMFLIWTLKQF